jgi:hypothetical protein
MQRRGPGQLGPLSFQLEARVTLGWRQAIVLWGVAVFWKAYDFRWGDEVKLEYRPRFVALPKPEIAKLGASGFSAALADLYWIGASHYFGEPRYKDLNYSQLHEYIDIVNELAPDFQEAYHFGGVAIPFNTGQAWVNGEYSAAILRRGLQRFPHDWHTGLLLAYVLGTYLGDFSGAGEALAGCANEPDAPPYLGALAARYFAQGHNLQQARELTEALLETAEDQNTRDVMLKHQHELEAEGDLQELESGVRRYRLEHEGRSPSSALDPDFQRDLPKPFDAYADANGDSYEYEPDAGTFKSKTFERFRVFGLKQQ